jgi:hypothetical protein
VVQTFPNPVGWHPSTVASLKQGTLLLIPLLATIPLL